MDDMKPADEPENLDPLEIAQQQFQRAHEHLTSLKRGLIEFFQLPKRMLTVCFPIEMEDKTPLINSATRVKLPRIVNGQSTDDCFWHRFPASRVHGLASAMWRLDGVTGRG